MASAKHSYGEYLLVLSGSAQDAPFLKDWKTLKDSVRQNGGRPGWTDVSSTPHERILRGWCNFIRAGNAEAAYSFHGSMQGAPVVPNPSILTSSTQSIVHPGIVYYAVMHSYSIPMVGLHVPIQEAIGLV
ncbi:predicted protein [Pyrenophora tritici-repentis Pt-1C-BFP]|uniref:Uncharacterized protein n=1 Tax=Pyrenophora tritici-repentis (strain Pt-1C-BFP) TaxID=426418 RepID=B2W5I4_PYRTR|nr:uncharacterized protein PTRG_04884 [Pyrenophora tritici-repentis Pt-1C-BFP]EDU47791.1 predicted protein [Pyrenophora tritici-repentis Pt-1C-BFP]